MYSATFYYSRAADFRMRAVCYRRLASLYGPDVAAVIRSVADDLEAAAAELEDGNRLPNRLRPAFAPRAIAN
jgi:hypothetical protein